MNSLRIAGGIGTNGTPVTTDPKEARFPLCLLLLFGGMVMVHVAVASPLDWHRTGRLGSGMAQVLFVAVLTASSVPVLLALRGRRQGFPVRPVDLLLLFIAFAGVPGSLIGEGDATVALAFAFSLAYRNLVLFRLVPKVLDKGRSPGDAVLRCLAVVVFAFMVYCSFLALRAGLGLHSAERFRNEASAWLHPNLMGSYAALGLTVALVGGCISWPLRVGLTIPCLYILLITQARTSWFGLIVTVCVFCLFLAITQPRTVIVWLSVFVAALSICIVVFPLGRLAVGPIKGMFERSSSIDPTSGRMTKYARVVESVVDSPVWGYGYMSRYGRSENGALSIAAEEGIVGLALNAILVAWILLVAVSTWRCSSDDESLRRLALIVILLTTLMVSRSLAERSHGFQTSDTGSNAWLVASGLLFASRRKSAARRFDIGGVCKF